MSASVPPETDSLAVAMSATNALFNVEVFGKRNFDAIDDIYTANASILPPGAEMICGRERIKAFWSNLVISANAKSAVLESVEVMPTGDGVVEIGRATLTLQPEAAGSVELKVKYVVYWRREDNHWKWHTDIWNTNS